MLRHIGHVFESAAAHEQGARFGELSKVLLIYLACFAPLAMSARRRPSE